MTPRPLILREIRAETDKIKSFRLTAADGTPLAEATPGAHIQIAIHGQEQGQAQLSGQDATRSYSLMPTGNPAEYRIGVRLEENSRGGSAFMHSLSVGQTVLASEPKNDFPLHAPEANETNETNETNEFPIILIAGGIGITPILSHAAALVKAGRPFRLHYSGRSRAQLAFIDELSTLCGDALKIHADDEAETRLDIAQLMARLTRQQHLYVCGPKGLLDRVLDLGTQLGWPRDRLHFELFTPAVPNAGDQAFELELRQSGKVLHVPTDKTILEVMEEAGCDPMFDCRRGECGVCQATVLEGIPDHRDYFLSDKEKAEGKLIQTCISRACSARLVLDL